MRHHPQVALTHRSKDRRGGDDVGGEVLELDAAVVTEHHHEAARRRSEAVMVELGEGDDLALRRVWLPVIRRRRDPLRSHRGSTGAQEPLLLQIPQPRLRHGRQAPIVGGDESHRHLVRRWRATLRISPLDGMMCRRHAGK